MSFWVCTDAMGYQQDGQPSIAAARHSLAGLVHDENIIAQRSGFMPPALSHVRSQPAFLFELNEAGHARFLEGGTEQRGFYPYG